MACRVHGSIARKRRDQTTTCVRRMIALTLLHIPTSPVAPVCGPEGLPHRGVGAVRTPRQQPMRNQPSDVTSLPRCWQDERLLYRCGCTDLCFFFVRAVRRHPTGLYCSMQIPWRARCASRGHARPRRTSESAIKDTGIKDLLRTAAQLNRRDKSSSTR